MGWGLHLSTVINLGEDDRIQGLVRSRRRSRELYERCTDRRRCQSRFSQYNQSRVLAKRCPLPVPWAYIDHNWSARFSTSIGYSSTHIENTPHGSPNAYKNGAICQRELCVRTLQRCYGSRRVFNGGKREETSKTALARMPLKVQFSFKYSFLTDLLQAKGLRASIEPNF